MKLKSEFCVVLATLFGVAGMAHANIVTNITAFCRANSTETYKAYKATLVQGVAYPAQYSVDHAFDGDVTTNDGRMLLNNVNTMPTPENPDIVGYDIADDFMPEARFVVNGFRFYRALNLDEIDRSITMIRLEASENGVDGWTVLGGTESPVTVSSAVNHHTVTIPMTARRASRHYRFVITANNGRTSAPTISTSELELLGEIMEPNELTLDGGSVWDATTANWTDAKGDPTTWTDRGTAVVKSDSVTLSGTAVVAELRLGADQTLTGGTLDFRRPGILSVHNGDVISSAIAEGMVVTDTVQQAATGTRLLGASFPLQDTEYTPAGATYHPHSVPFAIWQDRQVSEIINFVGLTTATYGWQYITQTYVAKPMYVLPDDMGLRFQLHADAKVDATRTLRLAEGFSLSQSNDCIVGQAQYTRYSWNADHATVDFNFTLSGMSNGSILDEPHNGQGSHYGAKGPYLAVSALTSGLTVTCDGWTPAYASDSYLPRSDTDAKTGKPVTFAEDAILACIVGFSGAHVSYQGIAYPAEAYHVKREGGAVSAQFKCWCANANATLCVKVEFTQNGPDIDARVVYSKYHRNLPLDWDCDVPAPSGSELVASQVYDDTHTGGYGVRSIVLSHLERVRFDGPFAGNREVTVDGVAMTLGAASLSLGQTFSGNGRLAFSPAASVTSQSVSFAGVCGCELGMELAGATAVTLENASTVPAGMPLALKDGAALRVPADTAISAGRATFEGTTDVWIGAGAAFALDGVEFAEDAVVNLHLADSEALTSSVRIGTSAGLSRAELNHFRLDGRKVNRQTSDGWLDLTTRGLLLIFK